MTRVERPSVSYRVHKKDNSNRTEDIKTSMEFCNNNTHTHTFNDNTNGPIRKYYKHITNVESLCFGWHNQND